MIETDDELAGSSVPLCPAPPVNCGVVLIIPLPKLDSAEPGQATQG